MSKIKLLSLILLLVFSSALMANATLVPLKYLKQKQIEKQQKQNEIRQQSALKTAKQRKAALAENAPKVIIAGFDKYKSTEFYLISDGDTGMDIRLVTADTIRVDNDEYTGFYLSWHPMLSKQASQPRYTICFEDSVTINGISGPKMAIANKYIDKKNLLNPDYYYRIVQNPSSNSKNLSFSVNFDSYADYHTFRKLVRINPADLLAEEMVKALNTYDLENSIYSGMYISEKMGYLKQRIFRDLVASRDSIAVNYTANRDVYINYFVNAMIFSFITGLFILLLLFYPVTGESIGDNYLSVFYSCVIGTIIVMSVTWWVIPYYLSGLQTRLMVSFAFAVLAQGAIYSWLIRIAVWKAVYLSLATNLAAFIAVYILLAEQILWVVA